jgi:hypothetical protein
MHESLTGLPLVHGPCRTHPWPRVRPCTLCHASPDPDNNRLCRGWARPTGSDCMPIYTWPRPCMCARTERATLTRNAPVTVASGCPRRGSVSGPKRPRTSISGVAASSPRAKGQSPAACRGARTERHAWASVIADVDVPACARVSTIEKETRVSTMKKKAGRVAM